MFRPHTLVNRADEPINETLNEPGTSTAKQRALWFYDGLERRVAADDPRTGTSITHLAGTYSSRPRNKLIAQVFYDLEIIERYGSGMSRMADECIRAGLPRPEIEEQSGGLTVTFRKAELTDGFIEMTVPGKPNSRLQKYRLTARGEALLKKSGN